VDRPLPLRAAHRLSLVTAAIQPFQSRAYSVRWVCLGALVVLNLADVWSTQYLLARGGVEVNPFMQAFADSLVQGLAIKAVCIVVIAVVLLQLPADRKGPMTLLASLVGWYGFVVAWNVHLATTLPV
jgi:hypothetical protein